MGLRSFYLTDRDWFGNVRSDSVSNKYTALLSGVQLSNCPYTDEKTLQDVLCKCPNLYHGNMNNCSFGGSTKSVSMAPELRMHYMRGDVLGNRGALSDDVNKGASRLIVYPRFFCCFDWRRSIQHRRRQGVLQKLAHQPHDFLSLSRWV